MCQNSISQIPVKKWTWVLSHVRRTHLQYYLTQFVPSRPWWQIATNHKLRRQGFLNCRNFWLLQFVTVQNTTSQIDLGSDFDVNMFYALRSIPSVIMKSIWEVVFWTVTNCNSHKLRHHRRNLWFVAISLVYLFVVMYISYIAHNRCTQETFLKGSDFDVNMFYALRSRVMHLGVYPRLQWNLSEKLCFEPSQIATVTNCDTIVAICDLSQFVIKAMTAQTKSNNTENVFWVLERVPRFIFDMSMKSCIFTHFGVISLVYLFVAMYINYEAHNRCTQETFLKGSDFDVNMFDALRSIPLVTMKSIWEVVFWTVTNCDSHKLRQFRNPCRRTLWFVAICNQGRDGTNWVK